MKPTFDCMLIVIYVYVHLHIENDHGLKKIEY